MKKKRNRLRRFLIESLENRLLLASDFVFDQSAFLAGLNAKLTNSTTEIRLVDANTNAVLHSLPAAEFTGNVKIIGSQGNDLLILESATAPFKDFSFDGQNGNDSFTVAANIISRGFDVSLTAETIVVSANQTINTFLPASLLGSITLRGVSIELQPNSSLFAGPNGDVSIEASNAPTAGASVFGDLASPVLVTDNLASIKVSSALIRGKNVSITAESATQTRWDDVGDYFDDVADSLLSTLSQVSDLGLSLISPISGQVKIQKASSDIVLSNAEVEAEGTVTIKSTSAADSSFQTVGINALTIPAASNKFIVSIGYGETLSKANVAIAGTTTISAKGDVTVATDVEATSVVGARGVGNARISNSDSVDLAIALALSLNNAESTVSTGASSRIESSAGSVFVNAQGESETEAGADAILFRDGIAGLAVSVAVDKAIVTSKVDGTIVAGAAQGATEYDFDSAQVVNIADNSITLSGIAEDSPITRGQKLIYHADNGRAIGGLVDGHEYLVADVENVPAGNTFTGTQTIRLATAMPLELDASQVLSNSVQTLGKLSLASFPSSSVTSDVANNLAIQLSGLSTGTKVTYLGPNSPVTELNITANFQRQTTGDAITRTDGGQSWEELGLYVGQTIQLADAGGNSRVYRIKAFGTNSNTLIVQESDVVSPGIINGFSLRTTVTEEKINANFQRLASGDTITRTDEKKWLELGLNVGQQIEIVTASEESQSWTIKSISSDGKTIVLRQANAVTAGTLTNFTLKTTPAGIGNLVQGQEYVVDLSAGNVRLRDPNASGTLIPFAGSGSGMQGFRYISSSKSFTPATAVDSDRDTIRLDNHGFQTGDLLVYRTDPTKTVSENIYTFSSATPNTPTLLGTARLPDAPIDGMETGFYYYVTRVDANTFRLSEASLAAYDAQIIDLTASSNGTQSLEDPESAVGVEITATLEAKNTTSAGTELSDAEQPWSDVIVNAPTNAESLLVGAPNAIEFVKQLRSKANKKQDDNDNDQESGIPLEFAGTFGVNVLYHSVEATVGSTAVIKSQADILVQATIEQSHSLSASSEATRNGLDAADSSNSTGEPREDTEISVAFSLLVATNLAHTTISDGATIDASGSTTIDSSVDYPLLIDSAESVLNPAETLKDGLDGFAFLLDGTLGFSSNLFNSSVTAIAGDPGANDADKFVIGTSVNLLFFTNESVARIGQAAAINQFVPIQSSEQSVAVTATTTMQTVDVASNAAFNLSVPNLIETGQGIFEDGFDPKEVLQSIVNPFGISGQNAIGPSLIVSITNNKTIAEVSDNARIHTSDSGNGLTVTATQDIFSLAVSQTGAKASEFGLTASVTVDQLKSETRANIGTNVSVTGATVTVDASDSVNRYGVDGGYVLGEKIGVGIAVAVNLQERTTLATIGSESATSDSSTGPALIEVSGSVSVSASQKGDVFALALAGAVLTEPDNKPTDKQPNVGSNNPTNVQNALNKVGGVPVKKDDIQFSFTLGASVAVNQGTNVVKAFVDDPAIEAESLTIDAKNSSVQRTIVIGGAVGTTKAGTNVGIGGAFAVNTLTTSTQAFLRDSEVTVVGTTLSPGLKVNAEDASTIYSDGGGVALLISRGAKSPTNIGIGLGVAINLIESHTQAFIQNATVESSAGDVIVNAFYHPTIDALTLGGAGAVTTANSGNAINITGAGAGAKNIIKSGGAEAHASNSTVTATNSTFVVNAVDRSNITVDAGAVAFALVVSATGNVTNLSFAFSAAVNEITSLTRAYLFEPNVSAKHVTVTATSDARIDALTIGGAVASGAFSGAGSGNTITTTTEAYLDGGNNLASAGGVNATGNVSVVALNDSTIIADAGGFSLAVTISQQSGGLTATGSIGIGASMNKIDAKTSATIRDITVSANAGTLTLESKANQTIRALSMAGAGAVTFASNNSAFTFAGAGAGSGNDIISMVTATVNDLENTDRTLVTAGTVHVLANDTSSILANAGGIALAVGIAQGNTNINVSIGASVAINNLNSQTRALVNDARLSALVGSGDVRATTSSTIDALTVAGAGAIALRPSSQGFGVSVAGAGTGSGNSINSTTSALVADNAIFNAVTTLDLLSVNTSLINAKAISGSISVQVDTGASVALGIAMAKNIIDADVIANADRSQMSTGGALTLSARSNATIEALTVGVAASVAVGSSQGSFTLAGSGAGAQSTNTLTGTIESSVTRESSISTNRGGNGNISILALDTNIIKADAGGGSLAVSTSTRGFSGAFAISAALAYNDIAVNTLSTIKDQPTKVSADGSLSLIADSVGTINASATSVAASVAIVNPKEGFALALAAGGSEAKNAINSRIASSVSAKAEAIANQAVVLRAKDNSTITAVVPSVAISVSIGIGFSIGVSLTDNLINNRIEATIDDATVRSVNSNVTIDAASIGKIEASASPIAVSLSVGASGAGGKARSEIAGRTQAFLGTNAVVFAGDTVLVSSGATQSTIATTQGGGAGLLAIGAMLAESIISANTSAIVGNGARVTSNGLKVTTYGTVAGQPQETSRTATSLAKVGEVSAVGGSGGKATSMVTGTVEAYVGTSAQINVAAGPMLVEARSKSTVDADAPGGSGGVLGVSALLADAIISGATRAYVAPLANVIAGSLDVKADADKNADASILVAAVQVVGGAGGKATSVDSASTEAYIGGAGTNAASANINITGSMNVIARSTSIVTTDARGGAGGAIAGVGFETESKNSGDTLAYASKDAFITAGSLLVQASAPVRTATANELSVSVVGAGVQVSRTKVLITGDVSATLGENSRVVTPGNGSISILADSITLVNAKSEGGSGGLFNVSAIEADALIGDSSNASTTNANTGSGVQLTTGTLSIRSNSESSSTSGLLSVGVGFYTGAGAATSESAVYADTLASLGSAASVNAFGNINIEATSKQFASADNTAGGGSVLAAVGTANGIARYQGTTRAAIVENANVFSAGSISINSTVDGAGTNAKLLAGTGGGISVGSTKAESLSLPTIEALIGQAANVRAGGGDINVIATGRGEADANAESSGGGVGQIGVAYATSTYTPTISATLIDGSIVSASRDLNVKAEHRAAETSATPTDTIQDRSDDADNVAVDLSTDTVDFAYPLSTGDAVVYDSPTAASAIGGLTDGRTYNVIVRTPGKTIQFGNNFDAAFVDPSRDVITFSRPHNFKPGDEVRLNANGGLSIVEPWQTTLPLGDPLRVDPASVLYVRGIYTDPSNLSSLDPFSIRLAKTKAESLTSDTALLKNLPAANINTTSNQITIPSHGFVAGQPVTYRAAEARTFATEAVDVNVVNASYKDTNGNFVNTKDVERDGSRVGRHFDNNNIFLLDHRFSTGDAVTYLSQSAPIGGLVNGATYFVIRIDGNQIQLARTYHDAVGLSFDGRGTADPDDDVLAIAVTPIQLTANGSQNNSHSLARNLSGLRDGQTYYVTNPAGNSFQLAATRGGAAIAVNATDQVQIRQRNGALANTLTPTTRGGTHSLGTLGIDLRAGSATQSLVMELTSQPSTNDHRLLGPGGVSLNLISPPPGDGISGAKAIGGSGGGIDVSVPTAIVTITPAVTTKVGSFTASRHANIFAINTTAASTNADTTSGGLLSVGEAHAETLMTSAPTLAMVYDSSTIVVGGNFVLRSNSDHGVSATARSAGGGAIAGKIAETTSRLNADTQAKIDIHSLIKAGGLLSIRSDAKINGRSNSETYNVGPFVGADSDNTNDDRGVDVDNPSSVIILSGVELDAESLDLKATISNVDVNARASATAYSPILLGLVTAFADAYADVYAPANVYIVDSETAETFLANPFNLQLIETDLEKNKIKLRGTQGVDIESTTSNISIVRDAYALAVALIPPQAARQLGTTNVTGNVSADSNALIVAGSRDQSTTPLVKRASIPQLSLFVNSSNKTDWDADVQILAAYNPQLVIDASGNVVKQTGVTFSQFGDNFSIAPIQSPGPGQVLFEGKSTLSGTYSTFTFNRAAERIDITTYKGNLFVSEITALSAESTGVEPKVTIDVPTNTLEFDVQSDFPATEVNISNLDQAPSQFGIRLGGLIDNPIGTTRLTAVGGIYSANFSQREGVVRTNRLFISTQGDAGKDVPDELDRIPIDIVESPNRPATMSVNAGNSIYVGIQGLLRDPAINPSVAKFVTTTDNPASSFVAGANADVMLLGGLDQRTIGNVPAYGIQVFETARVTVPQQAPAPTTPAVSPRTTLVTNHFRVSSGTSAAVPVGYFGTGGNPVAVTYRLGLVQAGTTIDIYKADAVTSRVNIISETNILNGPGAGNIDSRTNGTIELTETVGDMRIGSIVSSDDNISLRAKSGSMLDVPDDRAAAGDSAADVKGVYLRLIASGEVGQATNPLDIDSSSPRAGDIFVNGSGIQLIETTGDLNVYLVRSSLDATLKVLSGAIVDANDNRLYAADILGNVISLIAENARPFSNAIGTSTDPLEIDSSTNAKGGLVTASNTNVTITEIKDELYVLGVSTAENIGVRLLTRDSASSRDDIVIEGPVNVFNGSLFLTAGDDFELLTNQANATLAGGIVNISVDPSAGDPDAFGSNVRIEKPIIGTVTINGGDDLDAFAVIPMDNVMSIFGSLPAYPTFPGDTLTVNSQGAASTNSALNIAQGRGTVNTAGKANVEYFSIELLDRKEVNDPPVNALPSAITTDVTPIVLSSSNGNALSVSDADAGEAANFMVTLTVPVGTLALLSNIDLTVTGIGTSSLGITGKLSAINNALAAGVRFTPPVGFSGTTALTIVSNDRGNTGTGGPLIDSDNLSITVGSNLNDPPVNQLPAALTSDVETATFSTALGNALSVADIDAGNGLGFNVRLSIANGSLALTNSNGVTVTGTGTPTTPLSLTGTLPAINAALAAGLVATKPANFVGSTVLTIVSNDNGNTGTGDALTDTDSLLIRFTDVNSAPVNSLPPSFATKLRSTTYSFANSNAISIADLDAGDANNFSVKLTAASGILTFTFDTDVGFPNLQVDGNGSAAISLQGTLSDINAALARGIRHDLLFFFLGTTTLTVVSNDNGNTGSPGPLTDTDTLTITVADDVNDPPVNSLPANFSTNRTSIILSAANGNNLSVSDVDAGNAFNFQVTLSVSDGTLVLLNTSTVGATGAGTPSSPLQITGRLSNINAALAQGLSIALPNGFLGSTTLAMVSNDAGNTGTGGARIDTDAMRVTVVNVDVNDPPVNHLPADYASDQVFTLSQFNGNAISISDPDAGNASNFQTTLTVSSGTLLLTNSAGITVTGNGSLAFPLVLTGTLANINAALAAGVTMTSVLPQSVAPFAVEGTTLTVTSYDAGNTGAGGPLSDTDVLRISRPSGVLLNDAPVNHLPQPVITDQTSVVISLANGNALFVTDADAGNADNFMVTFSIAAGRLDLVQPVDVLIVTTTSPLGSSSLALTGTLAKINASLSNGLRFLPTAGFVGTTTIRMLSNDAGNTGVGGPLQDIDFLTITISSEVNDAPVNQLPLPIVTDQTLVILSAANGNALSVSDMDAGNATNFNVKLHVTAGTLSLQSSVNLNVTGNGTAANPLSLTGSISNINAVLAAGLRVSVPNGFTGFAMLTMVSNDAGNTGTGGPLTDLDAINLFFTQDINDAPINLLPPSFVTDQNPVLLSAALGNALAVVDVDAGNATNFSVRLTIDNGTLALVTRSGIVSVGNGSPNAPLQLTGTLSDINAVLATGVRFNPPTGFIGKTVLTMVSNDSGNTGLGGPKSDEDILNITLVSAVNKGPINLLPAPVVTDQSTIDFSRANANQLSVVDIDAGNANNFLVTLSVTDGTLSLLNATGITATGKGTSTTPLLLTGSLSAINTVLASGLRYSAPVGFLGTTTIVVTSNDNGNTGPGGPKSDVDFLSVSIQTDANDAPVNHLPASPVIPSAPFVFSGDNGNPIFVRDSDAGNANNFSVQLSTGDGQLSLTDSTGVTVTGVGTSAAPLRLSGRLADINAVLNRGLIYVPVSDFFGTTLLKVMSNDAGNTGVGGALTDTDYLPIRVLAPTNFAPQIMSVVADSTRWSKDFKDFVDGGLGDFFTRGYALPKGNRQMETLPWVNINRLQVVFSEDVGRSLSLTDFRLTPSVDYTALGIPLGTLPKIINYSYDSNTFTATIALSGVLPAAVFDLTIASTGVFDREAANLDGEWINGVTTGNSGNSVSGGDFVFRIFVLPGDARDESGGLGTRTVNSNDAQSVRDRQNGLVVAGLGDFNYNLRADLDGSAFINASDSQLVRDQQSAIIYRSSGARALQNPTNRRDVNNDGHVSPLDVLLVINAINSRVMSALKASNDQREGEPPLDLDFFLDVTGDENVSPLDALTVINWLNGGDSGDVPFEMESAEGEGANTREPAAASIGASIVDELGTTIDQLAEDVTTSRRHRDRHATSVGRKR